MGYVPHDPRSLFLAGSVVDEVALGLVMQGVARREARRRAEQELSRWGLTHLSERHPSEISEGEAVLVGILSVLVLSPTLVLLD